MSSVGRSQRGRGGRRTGESSSGRGAGSSQPPSFSIGSESRSQNTIIGDEGVDFDFPEDPIGGQGFEDPMIDIDFDAPPEPEDPVANAEFQRELDSLLGEPGRADRLKILDPTGDFWFGRDRGVLVRKISKIMKAGFHGPYYSWGRVPVYKRQRFFLTFARSYHWDPLITEEVKVWFDAVCTRRMKGMVSQVKKDGKRPRWIADTVWETMTTYWATGEAQTKSSVYSSNRLSERAGLGVHKHLSGQKSYGQVQQEMEEELGRPVTIGEVFIKTHTKSDGSYVDLKAKEIVDIYEKNLEERQSQLDPNEISDGTSRVSQIPAEEMNDLFIQSSMPDRRGKKYGLGSLAPLVQGSTRNHLGGASSQAFNEVREELSSTKRRLEKTEAELEEYKGKFNSMEMVLSYMRTDPKFGDFVAAQQPRGNEDEPSGSASLRNL